MDRFPKNASAPRRAGSIGPPGRVGGIQTRRTDRRDAERAGTQRARADPNGRRARSRGGGVARARFWWLDDGFDRSGSPSGRGGAERGGRAAAQDGLPDAGGGEERLGARRGRGGWTEVSERRRAASFHDRRPLTSDNSSSGLEAGTRRTGSGRPRRRTRRRVRRRPQRRGRASTTRTQTTAWR